MHVVNGKNFFHYFLKIALVSNLINSSVLCKTYIYNIMYIMYHNNLKPSHDGSILFDRISEHCEQFFFKWNFIENLKVFFFSFKKHQKASVLKNLSTLGIFNPSLLLGLYFLNLLSSYCVFVAFCY